MNRQVHTAKKSIKLEERKIKKETGLPFIKLQSLTINERKRNPKRKRLRNVRKLRHQRTRKTWDFFSPTPNRNEAIEERKRCMFDIPQLASLNVLKKKQKFYKDRNKNLKDQRRRRKKYQTNIDPEAR